MDTNTTFLLLIFCGAIGIFLRQNFLNIIASLIQFLLGLTCLFGGSNNSGSNQDFNIYIIMATFLVFVLFLYTVANLLIRRRSTLKSNEVAELRG